MLDILHRCVGGIYETDKLLKNGWFAGAALFACIISSGTALVTERRNHRMKHENRPFASDLLAHSSNLYCLISVWLEALNIVAIKISSVWTSAIIVRVKVQEADK